MATSMQATIRRAPSDCCSPMGKGIGEYKATSLTRKKEGRLSGLPEAKCKVVRRLDAPASNNAAGELFDFYTPITAPWTFFSSSIHCFRTCCHSSFIFSLRATSSCLVASAIT